MQTEKAPPGAATAPGGAVAEAEAAGWRRGLSRNVVVLGAVSLFTDISSEMIAPIRMLFLVYTLGTPVPIAGLIEGAAESMASLLKVISGKLADRLARRKPLILAGYGLSNAVKPVIAFALAWQPAFALIILDRIGKGIRTSPRDAVLADSTPREYRGKAFGLHRAMDTLGAAIGPLLTVAILHFSGVDLRPVFAWTVVPGALSVLVILFFLRERREARGRKQGAESAEVEPQRLGLAFWAFTSIATIFALGNSSDAFIFLRTQGIEQSLEAVPLVYFGYNVVYAALSVPLGHMSDRVDRVFVLMGGYFVFALVYAGWAYASQSWMVWGLFLLYGVYGAATEGVAKALVADITPRSARGTAMGWYNGTVGLAALPANLIAGWLWAAYGPAATFRFGAAAALVAALLLNVAALAIPRLTRKQEEATG